MMLSNALRLGVILLVSLSSTLVFGQVSQTGGSLKDDRSRDELADPTREFGGARQTYLQVDPAETAARLRRGLTAMREQTRESTEEGRRVIRDSVDEISSIADRLEQKREVSSARLEAALARAQFALAHNHLLLAIKARNENARERIGHELKAASEQVQHGVQHLGQDFRDEEAAIQNATKRIAKKLSEDGDATREEIHDALSAFRSHLANLRKRLWPDVEPKRTKSRD